jgi:hypothetical protein
MVGATCEKKAPNLKAAGPRSVFGNVTVTDVSLSGDNQITVTADAPLKGAPFSLTAPLRIGVDFRNAQLTQALPHPLLGTDLIDRVEVTTETRFARSSVRVTAYLRTNATYKVQSTGNTYILTIQPAAGDGSVGPTSSKSEDQRFYEETRDELDRLLTGAPPSGEYVAYTPPSGYDYSVYSYSSFSPPPAVRRDLAGGF